VDPFPWQPYHHDKSKSIYAGIVGIVALALALILFVNMMLWGFFIAFIVFSICLALVILNLTGQDNSVAYRWLGPGEPGPTPEDLVTWSLSNVGIQSGYPRRWGTVRVSSSVSTRSSSSVRSTRRFMAPPGGGVLFDVDSPEWDEGPVKLLFNDPDGAPIIRRLVLHDRDGVLELEVLIGPYAGGDLDYKVLKDRITLIHKIVKTTELPTDVRTRSRTKDYVILLPELVMAPAANHIREGDTFRIFMPKRRES
jgi:hypothetical protein